MDLRGLNIIEQLFISYPHNVEENHLKGKLYLEFGGKLCYDYHAARTLPGYHPNTKIEILKILKDKIEIIFCVSAKHIEDGRIRGDFGLTYDNITIKTIEDLRAFGLDVSSVVINRFASEKRAMILKNYLERPLSQGKD